MPRIRFASIRSLAAGVALTAVAPSAHAQICTPFTDVALADAFCSSIQWMHNRGITLGCTTDQYCPAQFVRRDQMAAFMFRLGNVVHQQGGNAFGATAVLGTTDGHPLHIRVNNERVMRYEPNTISPNVIGGNPTNSAIEGVRGATIGGGGIATGIDVDPNFVGEGPNRVTDAYGTVGGGYANRSGNDTGTTIDSGFATIGGGQRNEAEGRGSTIAGGSQNTASGDHATVGGGRENIASGSSSSVTGGTFNVASGLLSTVGGGNANVASGTSSTVPGGLFNTAAGDFSVAMGRRAKALGDGSFAFADTSNFDWSSGFPNTFRVRATGGVVFAVDIDGAGSTTWACVLTSGNSWGCASDRHLKQDLEQLDGTAVLDKLAAMPVYAWSPKGRNAHVRHYGPTAQDFHAVFSGWATILSR